VRSYRFALATVVIGLVAAGGPARALPSPVLIGSDNHRYIAASAEAEPIADEAVGPLDCAGLFPALPAPLDGTLGGACFDVSQYPPGSELEIRATDDLMTPPGMFAGFDTDGDGCIGCVVGADPSWESHSGTLAATVQGSTLAVFVRLASVGDDLGPQLGSVGNLHLDVFAPGTSPCHKGHPGGPTLDREIDCGEPFDGTLPYPYECIGACTMP
jgi:hypothetical protein